MAFFAMIFFLAEVCTKNITYLYQKPSRDYQRHKNLTFLINDSLFPFIFGRKLFLTTK